MFLVGKPRWSLVGDITDKWFGLQIYTYLYWQEI